MTDNSAEILFQFFSAEGRCQQFFFFSSASSRKVCCVLFVYRPDMTVALDWALTLNNESLLSLTGRYECWCGRTSDDRSAVCRGGRHELS